MGAPNLLVMSIRHDLQSVVAHTNLQRIRERILSRTEKTKGGDVSSFRANGDVHANNGQHTMRTRTIHAGEDRSEPVRPLSQPIYQSSVYAVDDFQTSADRLLADPPQANYSRDHFPNVVALERAVADLEGAQDGYAVSSGMAAISLVLLALLSADDHIVIAEGSYCDTEALLKQVLSRFNVRYTSVWIDDAEALEAAITPRTRLVFAETIANPSMQVVDIDAISRIAHRHGALLIVDNTFATPILCRPIEHGADLVVHSATKFLGGHHDLSAGVIVGERGPLQTVRENGYLLGSLVGAMDAWLAVRGIRTLAPRMSWICQTAVQVAEMLVTHPLVAEVSFPGLASGKQREVASRILPDGFGGMIRFRLRDGQVAAEQVLRALRLIPYAPSLGGTTTTICYPPSSTPCGVNDGCLRLSIGLESAGDITRDLEQALATLAVPGGEARELWHESGSLINTSA